MEMDMTGDVEVCLTEEDSNEDVVTPTPVNPGLPLLPASDATTVPMVVQLGRDAEFWTIAGSEGKTILLSKRENRKRRTAGNGLRQFATGVLSKVEQKGTTTYNEVADELVADLIKAAKLNLQCEEKNVRRRVYDALNVLLALKIIHRDKKAIRWTGMPSTVSEQRQRLEKDRCERLKRIERKKQELFELIIQLIAFKSLIARNRRKLESLDGEDCDIIELRLPFIVVNTSKQTVVDCWLSSDRCAYMFNFDRRFEIHDDVEVLKRMSMAFGLERGECQGADLESALKMAPDCLKPCILEMAAKRSSPTSEESTSASHAERMDDTDTPSSDASVNRTSAKVSTVSEVDGEGMSEDRTVTSSDCITSVSEADVIDDIEPSSSDDEQSDKSDSDSSSDME